MNPWQLAQQLKHELATVRWEAGSADVVFGAQSVFVYAGAVSDEELPPGFPFALVTIDSGTPDVDDPELLLQTFSIAVAVEVAGDPLGEFAVIGGARADLGSSAGAGIAEVSERVRFALQRLTGADGASLVVSGSGIGAPRTVGDGRHLALEEYRVTALCTSQPVYTAPQQLRVAGNIWTWKAPQATPRFDFLRFRLGFVDGSAPVSTPAELDSVLYTGTGLEAAVPTEAGRVYQIFADYDPRGTGSDGYSSEGTTAGAFVAT